MALNLKREILHVWCRFLIAVTTVLGAFAVFAFMQGSVLAQDEPPVIIKSGFLSGEQFIGLPETQRRAYAMGIADGFLFSPMWGAPKGKLQWLEECVVGMSDSQLATIIARFIQERPGEWHLNAHGLAFRSLKESCQ